MIAGLAGGSLRGTLVPHRPVTDEYEFTPSCTLPREGKRTNPFSLDGRRLGCGWKSRVWIRLFDGPSRWESFENLGVEGLRHWAAVCGGVHLG